MGKRATGNIKFVIFEVDHDPGIQVFELRLNGERLAFADGKARADVTPGASFTLEYSAAGEPGSRLAVHYVRDGNSTIVIDAKIPPGTPYAAGFCEVLA